MDIINDKGLSDINNTLLEKEGLHEENTNIMLSYIEDYFFDYLKSNSKVLKFADIANQPFKLITKIKKSIIGEERITSKLFIQRSIW